MDILLTVEEMIAVWDIEEDVWRRNIIRAQFNKINDWLKVEYGYEISVNDNGSAALVGVGDE